MLNGRLIRQFVAVAEELHYGRAAERVGIAQSPLSQAIQRLESIIGAPLFVRNKRSVALTAAGRVFLKEAYDWLEREQIALMRAKAAHEGERGQLSIGFIGSTGYGFMPELVQEFCLNYPDVRLRLFEMTTRDQCEKLHMRAIDVGLLRTPLPSPEAGLTTRPYQEDRLVALLPAQHPLASQPAIDLKSLKDETFVAFSQERVPAAYAQMLSVCAHAGFHPRIDQECTQIASIICVVATGTAVALVPGNLVSLEHPKVRYRPLSDDSTFLAQHVALAWRSNDDNPALASFLKVAEKLARPPAN